MDAELGSWSDCPPPDQVAFGAAGGNGPWVGSGRGIRRKGWGVKVIGQLIRLGLVLVGDLVEIPRALLTCCNGGAEPLVEFRIDSFGCRFHIGT